MMDATEKQMIEVAQIEDDPFVSIDMKNQTTLANPYIAFEYISIVSDIMELIVNVVSICALIVLIVAFIRFKRLRTKINTYFIYYAICTLGYILFAPMQVLFGHISFSFRYCYIYEIEEFFLVSLFWTIMGLGTEWYVTSYRPKWVEKYPLVLKYSMFVLYAVSIIKAIISIVRCAEGVIYIIQHVTILYVISLIYIITLNIIKHRSSTEKGQTKTLYALKIASVIIFSWLPLFIYHQFYVFIDSNVLLMAVYYTDFIPGTIAYISPTVVVYLLGKYNKHFKMAYDTMFNRSVRVYDNNEDLDSLSDEEEAGDSRIQNTVVTNALSDNDQTKIVVF